MVALPKVALDVEEEVRRAVAADEHRHLAARAEADRNVVREGGYASRVVEAVGLAECLARGDHREEAVGGGPERRQVAEDPDGVRGDAIDAGDLDVRAAVGRPRSGPAVVDPEGIDGDDGVHAPPRLARNQRRTRQPEDAVLVARLLEVVDGGGRRSCDLSEPSSIRNRRLGQIPGPKGGNVSPAAANHADAEVRCADHASADGSQVGGIDGGEAIDTLREVQVVGRRSKMDRATDPLNRRDAGKYGRGRRAGCRKYGEWGNRQQDRNRDVGAHRRACRRFMRRWNRRARGRVLADDLEQGVWWRTGGRR